MEVILGEDGQYRIGDLRPPRVTNILDLFFPPSKFYTEEGRTKGTARHLWYHAIAQGLEMENEPNPIIAAEVASFRRFMAEVRPVYISGEIPYYDAEVGVCGTPDLVCEIEGILSVVDFKPEAKNARTPLQTAAYKRMLRANRIPVINRFELRLSEGFYRLEPHRNTDDEKRWPIMAAAFHAASHYK